MEFTREIYWNVGHGPLTLVPMYVLAIGAIIFVARSFLIRSKIYKQGKELDRLDDPWARVGAMLGSVLLQKKVVRGGGAGYLHGLFFWAFFRALRAFCSVAFCSVAFPSEGRTGAGRWRPITGM